MKIFRKPALAALLAAVVFVVTTSGCRIVAPKPKGDVKVHSESDFSVNAEQMRLRMRALVQPLSGVIVASADKIIAGTTNNAIRRQALLWKIEAVPALREALFQPNPKTAIFDAWVMAIQMTDYFEKGAGKDGLGEAHGIAVTTCQHLETELARIAASLTISGDVSEVGAFAMQWAGGHPIRGSIASRESTLNRATEKDVATAFSTTEVVGEVAVTLDDLNRRIEIYSAQLLDQARWQAELFAMDIKQDFQVEKALPLAESAAKSAGRAVEAIDRLVPAVERFLAVLEKTPSLIDTEREAATKAMQAELTRTISFVQEERIAVVQDLRDTVVQEHKALTLELDRASLNMVDRAFLRAAQLCAALLPIAFVGIIALLFIVRRLFRGRVPPADASPVLSPP